MAKAKKNTAVKKKEETKPSIIERLKGFFKGIRQELKKVSWPDMKRLRQNTGAVVAIVLGLALLIFVFDLLVSNLLRVTGFYNIEAKPSAAPGVQTEAPLEAEAPEVEVASETDAEGK